MAPVTEIATLPLASGATIEDPSAAGKVWTSTLETVSQQDGFQRAYYGREVENPSVLQLLIDWDSIEHHQRFISSLGYGPFAKHLMTIIDGPLTMHHANFAPHPPSAAVSGTRSPVTEVLTCFFASKDSSVDGNAAQLFKVFAENAEGFKAAAGGWIIEDVEYNGEKRKAYAAVLGWESVEAHMKFRDTQIFKDNIHLLRDGPVGMEVHHTKFVEK